MSPGCVKQIPVYKCNSSDWTETGLQYLMQGHLYCLHCQQSSLEVLMTHLYKATGPDDPLVQGSSP